MGGIADYTGSVVCELPLHRAATVALQPRDDRQIELFSFNLLDEGQPFTLQMPLDRLIGTSAEMLRQELSASNRSWAGYVLGGLSLLHQRGLINLADQSLRGFNLAIYSTVPLGAGISSSAALEVAALLNFADHFQIRDRLDAMQLAVLAQEVENRICGVPCGVMDQVTSCAGQADKLLCLRCQPHELLAPLPIPAGMRLLGIHSGVRHSIGSGQYGLIRCAAFMAHRIILEKMREFGRAAGRTLAADPLNGYLANLDHNDYKKFFRSYLPESIKGGEFLIRFGGTIDTATTVKPDTFYPVRSAADHHVLEAMRVRHFIEFFEQAAAMDPADPQRGLVLDKAGHLMYGSHYSYSNDAGLGASECDLLVNLVRAREKKGLYGAKITGGGSGGTVAVLCEIGEKPDAAIAEIHQTYQSQTGKTAELFDRSGPGAWETGTVLIPPVR
jgi:L-arabinokinase